MSHRPTLIVIAGPNGSGKTSLASKVLKHPWVSDCAYINPDNIAKEVFGDWNSNKAVIQAANLAEAQREQYLAERSSMAFETVMSAPDKIDFIVRAKQSGYFIRLFFICTDRPSINAARIAQRVMEGGHDVPIPKIISRYTKSVANCAVAASIVDRAYIYDNSIDYAEPRLLFRTSEGKIVKHYVEDHGWAKAISSSLLDVSQGFQPILK